MTAVRKPCIQAIIAAGISMLLSGCMGAPLAQQLLTSAVMHGTDSIIENAYEAQTRELINNRTLQDAAPDPYWSSFVTAGFEKITPIAEPLPAEPIPTEPLPAELLMSAQEASDIPTAKLEVQIAPLVRVEVWNILIGEEKLSVLERAYTRGNAELPPRQDWERLHVATGAVAGADGQPIIFLVPPHLGKLQSGQETIVELSHAGDLNIARYAAR
ncbi:MAG: hypothetical protein CVU15_09575 [Betaproteobacteria bacterium HGW-Betaproteobacteria-1]|jgi:hypothetical protein|nr:MAG: hypothetical protein CVU15_09575 [Betaproteobacteria bacterium HGW-Betaproteobacteria-1]